MSGVGASGAQTRGYLVKVEACERLFYFIAHAPELLIDIFGGALGLRRVVKADVQAFPDIAGKCRQFLSAWLHTVTT